METIHLKIERKNKNGKTVTILKGLTRHPEEIEELAFKIKSSFGVGRTIKNGLIEIQGDVRKQATTLLQRLGFITKIEN